MRLRVILGVAGLVLASGCATAPKPAPAGSLPMVLGKFERRLADGRLYLAANLKNTSAGTEHAQVNCGFTDQNGAWVTPQPAALAVALEPGEVLTVHFEAATTAASAATISVGR
jgi:hypothetical protein